MVYEQPANELGDAPTVGFRYSFDAMPQPFGCRDVAADH